MPKHRHGYPRQGSRKWHGMAKRRIREELDYANLIFRLSGSDYRLRVRRASATTRQLPQMSFEELESLLHGEVQKATEFLSQLS